MATKNFSHSGTILAVAKSSVRVGFEAKGACGGCAARSKCGMVDSSTREVEVALRGGESYQVGDVVDVAISYQMGVVSVVVAYIVPLVLLVTTLAVVTFLGYSEGLAAAVSLGAVVIYYIVIYFFRSKLDKQIKFTIEKK